MRETTYFSLCLLVIIGGSNAKNHISMLCFKEATQVSVIFMVFHIRWWKNNNDGECSFFCNHKNVTVRNSSTYSFLKINWSNWNKNRVTQPGWKKNFLNSWTIGQTWFWVVLRLQIQCTVTFPWTTALEAKIFDIIT